MKVLIVSHYFAPHVGGIEVVAENQAKYISKKGHSVQVLTSSIDFKRPRKQYIEGYTINRVRALNFLETKFGVPFPLFSPTLVFKSFNLVKQSDVVHVHDAFYMSSFVAAFWAKLFKKPLFITQHVAMVPHPKPLVMKMQQIVYRTTGTFVLSNSKKVIVFNERVKNFLINSGVSKSKILSINNGVDFELFHPSTTKQKVVLRQKYNLPTEKTLALFVGRFVPKKGFRKLLHALSKDYVIVFVGGDRPSFIKHDEQALFLGTLSQQETAEIYQACDVFVLPSEGEGFPLSIQEAMASGLPVITTDDLGYRAYNFNRELFYLISPTVKEIKDHLAKITKDSRLRDAMGKYSYSYAKQYFNWDEAIEKISHTYQEALS